ncbi:DUF4132 domain-containing protein [Streptomyces rubellomurinus]|uniref:DUF4132 domain-containing protein n=1 Tax=Streptomyces rubellomurinus (strain ATCC 31215) TaxID=359131 RepID=A0A0F2TJC9_STRR3|nr:DUF4132 domain-containing protein [Streptomyces rubellomurinus]KJS63358.1 hypothetical protein VM95_03470 [Streptomyces rubellomurinus]
MAEPRELPDEDTFVLPAAWRPLVLPRRGGAGQAVAEPRPQAVEQEEELIASERDWVERVLAADGSDAALVRAARAYLAGEADPVGAAAVASMLPRAWRSGRWEESPLADAWVARHGLVFAARAVTEVFEVETHYTQSGSHRYDLALRHRAPRPHDLRAAERALADRVRALLAAADEATYEEAVAALAECRTTAQRRVVAAHLAPGTPGWADDCLADEPGYGDEGPRLRAMLLPALDDPAQVERLGGAPQLPWNGWSLPLIATLADNLGTACVPFLGTAVECAYGSDAVRDMTSIVARFPTDDAFRLLLARLDDKHTRPALQEAVQRYPVRAVRLLAAAAVKDGKNARAARQLLNSHVALNKDRLPAILRQLDPAVAELVRSLDGARERVAEASPDALPPLLVAPPWTRKRTRRKPRVLTGLEPDDTPSLTWRPGEQERWARAEFTGWEYPESTDWAAEAARVVDGRAGLWYGSRLLMQGPAEVLTPWVEKWRPTELWGGQDYLRPVVAKYGTAALSMAVSVAQAQPASLAPLLLPILDAAAARVMADGLVRLKSVQPTARSWFARHGIPAGLLLVPDAVGAAGPARRAAEQALRLVAAGEGTDAVLAAVVARYGGEAAEVVAEALATDPLENALPARMPVLPAWVQPAVLPQLLLASGEALPEDAVRHVLTMLALSKPADPYPGLAVVVEACRKDSLAEFAWALFEEWRQAAMPAKESWALHALGVLGDDETVRRLSPILRDWPGEGSHHRAVEGLSVLAGIGSDVALLHLHGIAQRVKFKALKLRAQEKISEVAEGLGLTGEQLSDRLVPDFSLDADGTTVIDYGPRRFTVGFDEQLRPFVLDADGKRRKDLPAPGVRDDQELAPAERKRFAALKKDVRTVAADQIRRLEAAMVAQRGWTAAEFRELFVQHPLTWHLVRRLVWLADTPGGDAVTATTAFRVAEDRTFADVADEAFALAEDATVRLAHPLHLGEAVTAWSELFADYEILQPFPQLGRAVHHLTAEEAAANRLHRFEGCTVPVGRLLGLTKRGWERGVPQDAGIERWFSKRLGDACHLVIELNEGIWVGVVDEFPDQTFETVWLDSAPGDYWPRGQYPLRFADLDPVVASELLADLEEVTAR